MAELSALFGQNISKNVSIEKPCIMLFFSKLREMPTKHLTILADQVRFFQDILSSYFLIHFLHKYIKCVSVKGDHWLFKVIEFTFKVLMSAIHKITYHPASLRNFNCSLGKGS